MAKGPLRGQNAQEMRRKLPEYEEEKLKTQVNIGDPSPVKAKVECRRLSGTS